MPVLYVPGHADPALRGAVTGGRFLTTSVRAAVRVEATRAAGARVAVEVDDDDLIELTLADGLTWWTTPAQLREDLRPTHRGDGAGPVPGGDLVLGPVLQLGPPHRGAGGIAIEALRVLGIDLPGQTAHAIAAHIERKLDPGPGLYRFVGPDRLGERVSADDLAGAAPSLVFIHGTASTSTGSFGGLADADTGVSPAWRALQQRYGDRIFAFEHETLTRSPLDNAVDLLDALPAGANLHLVTHSRGGLVGEIVARAQTEGLPFNDLEQDVFKREERAAELAATQTLNQLLQDRRLRVERFVRVACPAAGTTLASGRLDVYLNVIFNLLGRIPGLGQSLVYDFVADFAKAVAKERTDPAALPGLEAMMPGSPLVRVLNNPARTITSDLAVIAGDVKGQGLLRRLLVLATDLYYRAQHDYVVNTAAMYGGSPRLPARARYFFIQDGEISHFQYFRHTPTREALVRALAGETAHEHGFRPVQALHEEAAQDLAGVRGEPPAFDPARPTVVLIPGIMGSSLHVADGRDDSDRIWVNLFRLAGGGLARLTIDAPYDVQARGLVGVAYGKAERYLRRHYNLVAFPYDWRRSIADAADALAEQIEGVLDHDPLQPIRLLAHSMGGLVARTMIARHPDVWARLRALAAPRDGEPPRGALLVMLGTPNGGSYVIPEVVVGRAKTVRKLAMVDLRHEPAEILEIVTRFPGLLELLPVHDRHGRDYFERAVWDELVVQYSPGTWAPPSAAHLRAARAVWDTLGGAPYEPDAMVYVAGHDRATPIGHRVDESGALRFLATIDGDGRVPWSSGIPTELDQARRVWYMDVPHGKMAAEPDVFPALRDLLEMGTTDRLPQTPPADRSVVVIEFETPEPMPEAYPDEATLAAELVGFELTPEAEAEEAQPVAVSVTHGDLAYARYPVAVGHHRGDGIVSAEKSLDYHLGGRLSKLHRIGIYPGEIETAEVVLMPAEHAPQGGIVIGLGSFGDLKPGLLARSYAHAVLMLAARWDERLRQDGAAPSESRLGLSTVLVGSGFGGLTLRASIQAILEGVHQANERLRAASFARTIEAVEFIERYEDNAVRAAHTADDLIKQQQVRGFALAEPCFRRVQGAHLAAFERGEADWWDRIRVEGVDTKTGQPRSGLTFTVVTDRAGAPVESLPDQRRPLRRFLQEAVTEASWGQELAQTLFELLIPNDFKPYLGDRRNVLLILDKVSAEYPWELLHDGRNTEHGPLATRAGLIRQLATDTYRTGANLVTGRDALVVGAPNLGPDADFSALPGAVAEAHAVEAMLKDRFEVTKQVERSAAELIRKLLTREYRVLHLAGHGVFQHEVAIPGAEGDEAEQTERVTGMVIGPDDFLTPAIIEQMRRVPELVFINCCFGQTTARAEIESANRNRLAASLGTQLIRMGVRAVVVTGWAIDDAAAKTFAEVFYTQMVAGETFGTAVQVARERTYREHAESTTWGAYQCYGDPYFRLLDAAARGGVMDEHFLVPLEAARRLENLIEQSKTASERQWEGLCGELRGMAQAVAARRWDDGDSRLLELLAQAHRELDLQPEALSYYARLTEPHRTGYAVNAYEDAALLKTRLGAGRVITRKGQGEAFDGDLVQAEAGFGKLAALRTEPARETWLNRMGGAAKHMARVYKALGKHDRMLEMLRIAEDHYHEAHEAIAARRGVTDHYPLMNWLMIEAVLGWVDRVTPLSEAQVEQRRRLIEAALQEAEAAEVHHPSFWEYSVEAVAHLFYLIDQKVEPHPAGADGPYRDIERKHQAHGEPMVDIYRKAWRRGGSYRVSRSINDQFAFLIDMLRLDEPATTDKQRAQQQLAHELGQLHAEVREFMQ